jgi:Cysteine-rich CPCC
MNNDKYTCPCCGHLEFTEEPGSLEICKNCLWQDDSISLKHPYEACGPNKISLIKAQQNYKNFGVKELRLPKPVIEGFKNFDNDWRPIYESDHFLDSESMNCPEKQTDLYYWRDTYWLKK